MIEIAYLLGICASILETQSLFVRSQVSANGKMSLLGYVAWIQYGARMLFVLSIAILVFGFEAKIFVDVERFILALSIGSMLFMLMQIYSEKITNLFTRITIIFCFFNYNKETKNNYWRKPVNISKKTMAISLVLYTFLFMASFLPLLLAKAYSDYRMTLGMLSQIGNFIGTVIFIALLEPMYLKKVDIGKEQEIAYGMIYGRLASLGVISITSAYIVCTK